MSFSTILFTEKGRALQAKAQAGTTLNFTKLAMGSGSLGGQSQITLTALIDPKVILPINEIKRKPNYATIKGIFSNQDISTGFYWREIGLFAQDPDIGEILYCYGNAGTLAEYIPPQTSEIIEKVVSITAMIGDAATVTASIDESLVYVTKPELDAVSQKADQAFQSASNPPKVNNHTVESDVPANAKFTDTVYTHPTSHPASMITGLPTSLPANGGSADYATSAGNASNADKVGGLQPYQLGSLAQDGGSHGTQYAATPKYNVNGDNRFRLDIYNGGGVTHGVRVGYADGADNADTVDGIHLLTSTTIPTYLPNNVLCIVYE
ncbi:phage tail protein [Anaerocolumna sp. AGMB13025]|uniref:phage tail-collar fiber domain-containing protein n=1 Tax=Anaerocolumna sp. AGMB13025 TaxID=3039116 RepID=UPI00241DB92C|nr:phage tail protein [Anaerocolumna sp. AGMB13025]WFR55345.1 phage tail protein [Anaerocolumna sp. AGMB13025]